MYTRVITLVVGLWVSLGSASALAEIHPLVRSFGSFSKPNGIAIDESIGDLYVADLGPSAY
jgi:hypothetical protein